MGQPSPQPFQLHLADETLRDLRERLMRVRWPDEPPGAPWSTGSSVDYVTELVGLLARRLRLARAGNRPQSFPAVQGSPRGDRPALHS